MGIIHFLNVNNGDCSIIEHNSGRMTVIDICNGNSEECLNEEYLSHNALQGNRKQKEHPTNPIEYIKGLGKDKIFRFILTHPDMDHMDGIKNLFETFTVNNFWDTKNKKTIEEGDFGSYSKDDWEYYQSKRKGALHFYAGEEKYYYAKDDEGGSGDCLKILCPTKRLVDMANENDDYNNCSYMLLYHENGKKILFCGDSESAEWDVMLDLYREEVKDIDVLIAPHHGRKSGGNDEFLDILNPKLTLFGNASSKDLNYDDWNNRNLLHFTNNEGGDFMLVHTKSGIEVYCSYEKFAEDYTKKHGYSTFCNQKYGVWYLMTLR